MSMTVDLIQHSTVQDHNVALTHSAESTTLQTLPSELLAEIFSELDLDTLTVISYLSRRLRAITADPFLNPWRVPILRNLHRRVYERSFFHLSVRSTVPQQNWIEILTYASPSFLLFDTTLPHLKPFEWEECFRRRFLPGWVKWKNNNSWRSTFMRVLYLVWHRSRSFCTSDESWTKYIVVNRNGSVNELEAASRSFDPLAIFHQMKVQNDLAYLPTQIRVALQLTDARILAFGIINRPRSSLLVNRNAHAFLCPPRLGPAEFRIDGHSPATHLSPYESVPMTYSRLLHPRPAQTHSNYPMYTSGGGDQRWNPDGILKEGMQWVGGLMVTVQLRSFDPDRASVRELQGLELLGGTDQFASFTWQDFLAIAPWMEEGITECIHGQGLGIH